VLGIRLADLRQVELATLSDFAVALCLIPDLARWTITEKQRLAEIVRAKARSDETRYLKLMQKHSRLRAEMIRLGSS
jgi:hypothetical protein